MIIQIEDWLELEEASKGKTAADAERLEMTIDPSDVILKPDAEWGNIGVSPSSTTPEVNQAMAAFYHEPVLGFEVLEALSPLEGKQIFDGTLGGGGHSELMLEAGAHVIGCDQDPDARDFASKRLARFEDQILIVDGNFGDIEVALGSIGVEKVDGILLDIGVSSYQLDTPERGFSFQKDGPLDMRMDTTKGLTASEYLQQTDEAELVRIFFEYGEESRARKVAKAIVNARAKGPIETTGELSALVATVIPKTSGKNPATRVFQALRIAVNDELGRLEEILAKAADHLNPGGALAVISFHSLEDRMVKQFLRRCSQPFNDRPEWPEPRLNPDYTFNLPNRRATTATEEELEENPRSRSAKLRVGIRV